MSEKPMETPEYKEAPPNLEQLEGAKDSVLTFVMYYYQACRQAGMGVEEAKKKTADMILEMYNRYAQMASLPKIQSYRDPFALLDEAIRDAQALGVAGRALYAKLVDLRQILQLSRRG